MGVLNGQSVDQTVTNSAFINKNQDDTMSNKLSFDRALSGPTISDIQQAVNNLYTASGVSESTTGTVYNAPSNTITNGDNYQTALTKLANKFAGATGHMHTGVDGDGPLLSVVRAIAASGSTNLTGNVLIAGQNGAQVTQLGQTIFISATGHVDSISASGNVGLNGSVVLVAGSGVSLSQSGQNITISATGNVTSIAASGNAALTGAVVLVAGSGVQITESGQNITIAASGALGGGGGGGSLLWVEGLDSPTPTFENNIEVYAFDNGLAQYLYSTIKVPNSFTAGNPIKLRSLVYSPDSSGNVLFQTIATLIRTGTDAISSTTNQRTSTNSAITLGAGTVNKPQSVIFDLTDTTGNINAVAVSPGDLIIVQLKRGTDTATSQARAMVFASELTIS